MVKRRKSVEVADLTAEDGGGPAAQRLRRDVEPEPDHLLCPITREMFRDPVMLVASGHTYERAAIEEHLRRKQTDPLTNVRVESGDVGTNMAVRKAVESWLEENPGRTPDGWDTRTMKPAGHLGEGVEDERVLRAWRASCPELQRLWRQEVEPRRWQGVTWDANGRVVRLSLRERRLSGVVPCLLGMTSLEAVNLSSNQLSGAMPEKLFQGLTSLNRVDLSENQLSGAVPEKLFQGLTSLACVHLHKNQLSGAIPEKLFESLTYLQVLKLGGNDKLKGVISGRLLEGLSSLSTLGVDLTFTYKVKSYRYMYVP